MSLTALSSNRFVKFAAVLDNNGKLIVGEYRKGIQNYWPTDFISDSHYHHHGSSYFFHLDYLIPAIKKREFSSSCSAEKEEQEEVVKTVIEGDANYILQQIKDTVEYGYGGHLLIYPNLRLLTEIYSH
jgi:hypothetical protein